MLSEKPVKNPTAAKVAAELGIGERTLQKHAAFSRGIDKVKKHDPELADQILKGGKETVPMSDIRRLSKLPEPEFKKAVDEGLPGIKAAAEEDAMASPLWAYFRADHATPANEKPSY